MVLTADELERVAEDRGITVLRLRQPVCVYGGEARVVKSERVIDPVSILDEWSEGDVLLLYQVFMRPADELVTVRYAKGTGHLQAEDIW